MSVDIHILGCGTIFQIFLCDFIVAIFSCDNIANAENAIQAISHSGHWPSCTHRHNNTMQWNTQTFENVPRKTAHFLLNEMYKPCICIIHHYILQLKMYLQNTVNHTGMVKTDRVEHLCWDHPIHFHIIVSWTKQYKFNVWPKLLVSILRGEGVGFSSTAIFSKIHYF